MAKTTFDDGYVEDSEGEETMLDLRPPARNPGALPLPPRLQPPEQSTDSIFSTIQTANFTKSIIALNHPRPLIPESPHGAMAVSSIETASFTADRSTVSNVLSANGSSTRLATSSIQSAQTIPNPIDSSISMSTSVPPPPAQKSKPRPRPVVKRKDPSMADTSISNDTPSSAAPSAVNLSFSSWKDMPPPLPPVQASMALPSSRPITSTATTVLATGATARSVSDSGVELLDLGMDIASRAKLRSRARSQAKGKPAMFGDDVIELSSSDDELSILPMPKPKPKPKPKKPTASKQPSTDKPQEKGREKGKTKDPAKPPLPKRAKKAPAPESGFESDVDTIPVLTSDFPIPHPLPPHLHQPSSQLPPSDPPPPPSTSGSSSAQSAPHTSQDISPIGGMNGRGRRDESPLSSPPPPMPRKRKRPAPVSLVALGGDDSDFGADEDSFLAAANDAAPAEARKAQKKPNKNADESVPLSPPLRPVPSPGIVPEAQPPAKSKPAARRKRKSAEEDEEEWGGDAPEMLSASKGRKKARMEEEDEDEWAGDGASKAKAKGKKAAKKPAKARAPKGKAAAKGKAPTSTELVEDSDEEQAPAGGRGKDKGNNSEAMPPPPIPAAGSKRKDVELSAADVSNTPQDPLHPTKKGRGKQRAVVLSDDEDDGAHATDVLTNRIDSPTPAAQKSGRKSSGGEQGSKENDSPALSPPRPLPSSTSASASFKPVVTTPNPARASSSFAHANRAYTISAKKSTPMSELIRRVSSLPGSPFPASSRPTYSPLAKASKSVLRRIAPLHPNRRTPPPPPPRPPPPKKSKKMLDLEEKWEMELADTVEGWYAMSEEERAMLKRQKRDHELGFED